MSTHDLTILLVEDDPFARALLEQILSDEGYRIKMAKNGQVALKRFYEKNDIDLIITDMTMPKISGVKLAIELMNIKPDIPVIICTGYSKNISKEKKKHFYYN